MKDNDSVEDEKLMSEWDQYMKDFVPEDINTVVIDPRTEFVNIYIYQS